MKSVLFSIVMAGLLSACMTVDQDTSVSVRGNIVGLNGNPQILTLNTDVDFCFDLRVAKDSPSSEIYSVDDDKPNYRDHYDVCQPLTTDTLGNFSVLFNNRLIAIGETSSSNKIVLSGATPYLKINNGKRITGKLVDFKYIGANSYSAKVQFTVNASDYRPDQKIEINNVNKKY